MESLDPAISIVEQMIHVMKTDRGKMEANTETGQEPREAESKTSLRKGRGGNHRSTAGSIWGRASSRRAPTAEETDPGRWWVPEEADRRPQTDDPP
jgi:hypothetical protein